MAKNKPEILSPAGSPETLEAAARCGADAVYLGAKQFSARRNAENFDDEQLCAAVKYCHIRGIKVYLTLNIMLRDDELESAVGVIRNAVSAGIDGIIVQDLGLARIIGQVFPTLPLHASTQMSVHTPAALSVLKKLGFCRVVAAREMSAEGIKELCRAARALDMTIEVFVHGALCMSVSGQCLLSAVLGGRSGNRGLCAGPCRLPFSVQGGTGYDLSLKDLSLLEHLGELAEYGVASFKIEGRMKRPEYVAAATAACRAALDSGTVPENLAATLRDVFSRSGFTDGYFTGKTGREMFGIRTKEDVTSADAAFLLLHGLYRTERQAVALTAHVEIKSQSPSRLTLSDGKNTVTASGALPEAAEKKSLDADTVRESLEKLGGTPYYISHLELTVSDGLFLRGSDLNALRRNAVAMLDQKRSIAEYREENSCITDSKDCTHAAKPALIVRFETPVQIPADLSGVAAIMLPLETALPEKLPENIPLIVDVPRGIVSENALVKRLIEFRKKGFCAAYCGNLSAIPAAQSAGLAVVGAAGLNIFNGESAAVLKDCAVRAVTLSAEIRLSDAIMLKTPLPKGIFAYGRLPLMLTKNCPAANGRNCAGCDKKNLMTDRKGISFPVRCRGGFSEVLNSVPIFLADRLSELRGLDFLLLYFTDEDERTVQQVLTAYKSGGAAPESGYTRGLYYRGAL